MPDPEYILKQQLRDGDLKAFKALFESYYHILLKYAISLTQNPEVSKGIVQEVFLKLWENHLQTKIHGSLKSYLFAAVNNKALNWIRHEKIKRAYENDSLYDTFSGVELPQQINPFLREAIQRGVESLPKRALEIFSLTQLDGLSHKDTANKLGISVKTVENQLSRARKILQKQLKKYR